MSSYFIFNNYQSRLINDLLHAKFEKEGDKALVNNVHLILYDGIIRGSSVMSENQQQTEQTFGFKWKMRNYFDLQHKIQRRRRWLRERYEGLFSNARLSKFNGRPLVMDAGCGAGMSGLIFFEEVLEKIDYIGIDVSSAVDMAKQRFEEAEKPGLFMQLDILNLPFPKNSFDLIFSEGVLHHTDSTERALKYLVPFLKPGGQFMFYVYKKKGPIREFTDDYIRDKLQDMSEKEAWEALLPLTKLGKLLGDLDIEIDLPEGIDILEIPAGKINLQRFLYWHVMKMFYQPEWTIEEMNMTNYDWYAPANAHRQTLEEVKRWCHEAGMSIIHQKVEDAGITIIGTKSKNL